MPPSINVLTSASRPAWPTSLMALKIPLPSPNVMVPKQSFETRRPVLPSVAYSMVLPAPMSPRVLGEKVSVVGMRARLVPLLHPGLVTDGECGRQEPLVVFQLQPVEQVDVVGRPGRAIAACRRLPSRRIQNLWTRW